MADRFHRVVRARRLQLGMTQRQVADALGIKSADFVSLVEAGRRRFALEHIPALAQVLDLDPRFLCRLALRMRAPQFYGHVIAAGPSCQELPA